MEKYPARKINKRLKLKFPRVIKVVTTSFFICFSIYLLINWHVGRYPFGDVPVALGDEAWQFLPFYSDLWEVMHRNPNTSIIFSWNAGLGVPRIGDYATYMSGPFPLLIALFPKAYLGVGYFIIKGIKISFAGAAFSALIYKLAPTQKIHYYQIFAIIYAFSGWTLEIAAVRIIWIDGLIALPLITIAGILSFKKNTRGLVVAIICFAWWSNYYTAYMASLGAALVIIIFSFTYDLKPVDRVKGILNFAMNGTLGVCINAVILLPTYVAIKEGVDIPGRDFQSPPVLKLMKSMYGGTVAFPDLPTIFVGYFLLLCLVAFFINPQIKGSLKFAATIVLLLSVGSLFFKQASLVWNLFDSPNGTWFRYSFILIFYFVLIGFYGFINLPQLDIRRVLFCCLIILLPGLWAYCTQRTIFTQNIKLTSVFFVSLFGAVIAFILLTVKKQSKPLQSLQYFLALGSIVLIALLNSGLATSYFVQNLAGLNYPVNLVERNKDLFRYQYFFSGRNIPYNNGLLYGVPEATYYSSIVPQEFGVNFAKWIGTNSAAGGRMVSLTEDPYLMAVSGPTKTFAVKEGDIDIRTSKGLPFISRIGSDVGPNSSGNMKENTFMRRERVVGSSIYSKSVPVVRVNGKPFEPSEGSEVSSLKVGDSVELSCSDGTVPQMLIQQGSLRVQIDGKSAETFTEETILSGMNESVKFQVMEVGSNKNSWGLRAHDFKCLDVQKLDKAMGAFNAVAFNRSGRFFSFQGNKGEIYKVRVPYSEKWKCGAAELRNVDEFLAIVPKDSGTISCKYELTGLTTGMLISVIACALTAIFSVVDRRIS